MSVNHWPAFRKEARANGFPFFFWHAVCKLQTQCQTHIRLRAFAIRELIMAQALQSSIKLCQSQNKMAYELQYAIARPKTSGLSTRRENLIP